LRDISALQTSITAKLSTTTSPMQRDHMMHHVSWNFITWCIAVQFLKC